MEKIFSDIESFGEGYICKAGQFSKAYAIDFYDGIVEGILLTQNSGYLVYVKKAWWDSSQENRLYECWALNEDLHPSLGEKATRLLNSKPTPADQDKEMFRTSDEVKAAILNHIDAIKFNILSKDLNQELFVLPIG